MKSNSLIIKKTMYTMAVAAIFTLVSVIVGLFFVNTAGAAPVATSVSTGPTSACAVVDRKVQCWGDGSNGKLGNGSTADSAKPVAVHAKAGWTEKITCSSMEKIFGCKERTVQHAATLLHGKPVTKVSVGVNHACAIAEATVYCWGKNDKGQLGNGKSGWLQKEDVPVAVIKTGSSALVGREIVDISAGDDFTCALASDGTVACWGEGDNGRLGTNATADKNVPAAVYGHTASGISSSNQTNIVLAQTSKPSQTRQPSTNNQNPSPTPTATPKPQQAVGLAGKKGVKLSKASEATMCVLAIDVADTSLSGNAYCWGKGIDGGQPIPGNDSDAVACNKDAPTSQPRGTTKMTIFESSKPTLIPGAKLTAMDGQDYVTALGTDGRAYYWGMYGYQESVSYSNVKSCKVNPCTGKVSVQRTSDSLDVSLAANMTQRARDNARAGNADNRGRPKVVNGHPGMANYQIDKDNNCNAKTHYGYTKNVAYTPVGQKETTQPSAWPAAQTGLKAVSGNVHSGLFCAASGASVQCDAHGTSQTEGQTGSGFVQTCKLFSCTPPVPQGPQTVASGGWLAGKQVTQLSTSSTGYTCAVASGSIGCWGVNTKGQLGVGDKKSKNTPTSVGL